MDGLWAVQFGNGGATESQVAHVLEDVRGDLWLVGDTQEFGPSFTDGWLAKLDVVKGRVLLDQTIDFGSPRETHISGAILEPEHLFVAGGHYSSPADQHQPTIGEMGLDGVWKRTWRMAGGLIDPGQYDQFFAVTPLADGGLLAVGETSLGTGSCSGCKGTDALVVKLRSDRSIEWAQAIGSSIGDENVRFAVQLPDGDVVAAGGARGSYDFSQGAGTNIDGAPIFAVRFGLDGTVKWTRRLLSGPGGGLLDGFYDVASGTVVMVGYANFGNLPVVIHVDATSGNLVRGTEVILDDFDGAVTGVSLAEDGGLFLVGHEYVQPGRLSRNLFVARLTPDRDAVAWSRRASLGPNQTFPGILRTRAGALIVWATGTGAQQQDVVVLRMTETGASPACWPLSTAAVTLRQFNDVGVDTFGVTTTVVASPVAEPQAPSSAAIPGAAATCD